MHSTLATGHPFRVTQITDLEALAATFDSARRATRFLCAAPTRTFPKVENTLSPPPPVLTEGFTQMGFVAASEESGGVLGEGHLSPGPRRGGAVPGRGLVHQDRRGRGPRAGVQAQRGGRDRCKQHVVFSCYSSKITDTDDGWGKST